jgi:DNA invertase Pin-like site-specific DNA recombinase
MFFPMVIGYARVSTVDQKTEAQLPELRKAGCKRIYQENVSGSRKERPELEKCLDRLEKGDTLVVWRLDRLGRSTRELFRIVDDLDKKGIHFVSLKEKFDTSTASGRLIFHFFAAMAQFERELNIERTKAGLAAARARGRVGGRKTKLSPQQVRVAKTMWDSHKHTKQDIATHLKVSISTIDRIVRPVRLGDLKEEETTKGGGK